MVGSDDMHCVYSKSSHSFYRNITLSKLNVKVSLVQLVSAFNTSCVFRFLYQTTIFITEIVEITPNVTEVILLLFKDLRKTFYCTRETMDVIYSVYNLRHIRPMSSDTVPVKASLH